MDLSAITLSVGLAFTHHAVPGDWHEIHPNLTAQYERWLTGVYWNSEDALSVFVAYDWQITSRAGVQVGLVAGYESVPVLPMARGYVELGHNVEAFVFPAVNADTGDVGVGFGINFKVGVGG